MTSILAVGLAIGLTALTPPTPALSVDHATRLDHHSGPVDARYRGDVVIRHRQVGAVGPGGRQSTLRCAWQGNMTVAREARAASGAMMTRVVSQEGVVAGTRPGWCSTHSRAIAAEVAARRDEMDRHLQAMAHEDHTILRAELDRAHRTVDVG